MILFYIATNDMVFKRVLEKFFIGNLDEKTITILIKQK